MAASGRSAKSRFRDRIFKNGKRLKGKHSSLFFLESERNLSAPLFCVANKAFRTKPRRNKLKRILREAYRSVDQDSGFPQCDIALMVLSAEASLRSLKSDLELFCKHLKKK